MSGREFWRGGRRGGSLGAGFGGAAMAAPGGRGDGVLPSFLLTGGGGRCDVDRPVVSTRYGPGGGLSSSSSAACW